MITVCVFIGLIVFCLPVACWLLIREIKAYERGMWNGEVCENCGIPACVVINHTFMCQQCASEYEPCEKCKTMTHFSGMTSLPKYPVADSPMALYCEECL